MILLRRYGARMGDDCDPMVGCPVIEDVRQQIIKLGIVMASASTSLAHVIRAQSDANINYRIMEDKIDQLIVNSTKVNMKVDRIVPMVDMQHEHHLKGVAKEELISKATVAVTNSKKLIGVLIAIGAAILAFFTGH